MENEIKKIICPRCFNPYNPERYALSRIDNKTRICSLCGTSEALLEATLLSFIQDFESMPTMKSREKERRINFIKEKILEVGQDTMKGKHYQIIIQKMEEI